MSANAEVPISARTIALLAVQRALLDQGYSSETLRQLVGALADERERALAREIATGALRRALTLECIIGMAADYDRRRVRPEVRAALLCGAYQLVFMDRIPPFAAVDATVELVQQGRSASAASFVNAILRRIERAITDRSAAWQPEDPTVVRTGWNTACHFKQPVLPRRSDRERHLAAAAGVPLQALIEWTAQHGWDRAAQIAWAGCGRPPTVLRRNILRGSATEFAAAIRATLGDEPEIEGDLAFLPPAARVSDLLILSEGGAYVQDETAAHAATLVAACPGERVLDLCGAPGGKTIAMALSMNNQGELVASDSAPERLERLNENVRRLGLTCVQVVPPAQLKPGGKIRPFDAVIVDAPCSNSGVLARRVEARLRLSRNTIAVLGIFQSSLLREGARHVRPGGRLAYSTCSIDARENDEVVDRFIRENPEWSIRAKELSLPVWGARLSDWRDGGFVAVLARRA